MLANILYIILFIILFTSVINLTFIHKGDMKSFVIFIACFILTIVGCKLIALYIAPIKIIFSFSTEWKVVQWILAAVALVYLIKSGELTSENIKKNLNKFMKTNNTTVEKNYDKNKENVVDLNEEDYNIEETGEKKDE